MFNHILCPTDLKEREMLRVSVSKMKEKYKHIASDSKKEMKAVIHKLHADDIYHRFTVTGDGSEASPFDKTPPEERLTHKKGNHNILRKTAIFLSFAPDGC